MFARKGGVRMDYIIMGFVFLLIDFSLSFGEATLDLFPDFVAYLLILKGLRKFLKKGTYFVKCEKAAQIMFGVSLVIFVLNMTGVLSRIMILAIICGVINTTARLYISYNLVIGIKEVEESDGCNLEGETLLKCWKVMAVFAVIGFGTVFIPIVRALVGIAGLVTSILFLMGLYDTGKASEKYIQKRRENKEV